MSYNSFADNVFSAKFKGERECSITLSLEKKNILR